MAMSKMNGQKEKTYHRDDLGDRSNTEPNETLTNQNSY